RPLDARVDETPPAEHSAVPVDAGVVLQDAVRRDQGRRRHEPACETDRGAAVLEPPEHTEVGGDDPEAPPADGLEWMATRERRQGEDAGEQQEHLVEGRPADDRRAAPRRDQCQHEEPDHPDLHAARRERDGPRREREAGVRRPPKPRFGHQRYTPRRVSMTFAVSDRIFRSSQIERLYMYAKSYLSFVVGDVWYSPFTWAYPVRPGRTLN